MTATRIAFAVACLAAVSATGTACGDSDGTTSSGVDSSVPVVPPTTTQSEGSAVATAPPSVSESPPLPRMFVDEDGLRCVEYETSAVNLAVSGVCFDDEYDELGVRTVEGGTHYPSATILGATDDADAVRVVIVGDGAEQDVALTAVDGWPERIFVADLPSGGAEVRLIGADGQVLASERL